MCDFGGKSGSAAELLREIGKHRYVELGKRYFFKRIDLGGGHELEAKKN